MPACTASLPRPNCLSPWHSLLEEVGGKWGILTSLPSPIIEKFDPSDMDTFLLLEAGEPQSRRQQEMPTEGNRIYSELVDMVPW